jgi:hypothetical protein
MLTVLALDQIKHDSQTLVLKSSLALLVSQFLFILGEFATAEPLGFSFSYKFQHGAMMEWD